MNWLRKFMYGRYGVDALSMTIIIFGFLISIFSPYFRPLSIISTLIFIYAYYRVLSKDINKRYRENQKFLKLIKPVTTRFKKFKTRSEGRKSYKYFKCKNCKQEIKVPKGKGKVRVTCPKCGEKTIKKS
ncbi:hypothetical protein [Tissierella creatinophila]|uniref:Zn-finger containing protein n=1 Tax=Tissierella creatinophila DSM 6911 TaxID=1123403 RepID=A0A1U7M508_TISCR|nr:hypothetical protein [Tissierella creatinophila]OLS02340.1 hypothetical protein TICRE_17270 [Tissierella creatinophila DSM 6911]